MPHAYSWLIGRLEQTGKAISFGRVYRTNYHEATGRFLEKKCAFEFGSSYDEFIQYNIAPLHSLMLDMKQLDTKHLVYFEDQRFMEDYMLTLQLITRDNADWKGLVKNVYIGDYIYCQDRTQTLAISNEKEREALLSSLEYKTCEKRISDLQKSLSMQASNLM